VSTLTDTTLTTMTRQLADFLDLPDTLDLPELCNVQLLRSRGDSEWEVQAQLAGTWSRGDLDAYEQVRAWSVLGGGTVRLGRPVHGGDHSWRRIDTTVCFVGVRVVVWTHVSGDFEVPPSADGLAAALLLDTAGVGSDGE
jgi:hypothetical protein